MRSQIAPVCRGHKIWLHIDGAGLAPVFPEKDQAIN
jgi:glutamate/tyrosine decarboxylase-like PLP-dependent enzyme